MVIVISICALLCAAYCAIIVYYRYWFGKLTPFIAQPTSNFKHFSIIIPARNEADNIGKCLQSIYANTYAASSFEVLVIDDFSTDETARIVQQLQQQYTSLRLLKMQELLGEKPINSYKKKAIELAVQQAKGDWIITTDADCLVPPTWLENYNNYIQQHQPVFVAAPVNFINTHSFVSVFQCLDFLSLQGITAAAVSAGVHSMCNGANLAYEKEAFMQVGGFAGINNIASGDDMLLMHKILQAYPNKAAYLFTQKSIVRTLPMPSWRSFINQRIRWASKASSYTDKRIFYVLLLVYCFNVAMFLMPFAGIFYPPFLESWLIFLLLKTVTELLFLQPVATFFGEQKMLWWFPVMQPFHITYTVLAGWLGKFGKYDWKGRNVK